MKKKSLNVKKLKVQSFVTSMDDPADNTVEVKGGSTNACIFTASCGCTNTCYSNLNTGCFCPTQDFYGC